MDINYKKQDNHKLFHNLEENTAYGFSQPQNYIPIYDRFFSLSEKNYNSITLDNKQVLYNINTQESYNIFNGVLKDSESNKKENKRVYLKYSPLLDPTKYLIGKYDASNVNMVGLPAYEPASANKSEGASANGGASENGGASANKSEGASANGSAVPYVKINDANNSAYVDSFFAYLSSKLLHNHGFTHGLDFYGSFLSIKHDFRYDISDDMEYLQNSTFFHKNNKVMFEMDETIYNEQILNGDTRNYKKKLVIGGDDDSANPDNIVLTLSDINELSEIDTIVSIVDNTNVDNTNVDNTNANNNKVEILPELLFENVQANTTSNSNKLSHTGSVSCSSRSSNTSGSNSNLLQGEEDAGEEDDEDEDDEDYEDIEESEEDGEEGDEEEEEETVIAKIKNFPVNVIALECCDNTLDALMNEESLTADMWDSIVMQLLLTLVTFQNAFGLTHNDLHTNNVMYVKTAQKFLYYKLNHVYYKVPTYGRLFKIIDYGRAIYKFRGKVMCSDSYHQKEGDAATQYNCEPYFNAKKPRLEPNFSFDLCRLGCALYDSIADEPRTKINQIIMDWCNDDKGRNILYKKNGDERYPDFKLYKMIARTVHKHVPIDVLNNAYFDKFIVSKNDIKKHTSSVMDLDSIPSYTNL